MSFTVLFGTPFGTAALGAATRGLAGKAVASGAAKSASVQHAHHVAGGKLASKVTAEIKDQAIDKVVDSVWRRKKGRA